MAVITIPWTTGTGNIYLTCESANGTQIVQVTSDANTLYEAREQILTFATPNGGPTATLKVKQLPMGASFDNSFDLSFTVGDPDMTVLTSSDTVVGFDDTVVGYND